MPKEIIHDIITGEITEQEYSSEQLAEYNKLQKDLESRKTAEAQAAAAKQALLTKLGITADEAKLLLS